MHDEQKKSHLEIVDVMSEDASDVQELPAPVPVHLEISNDKRLFDWNMLTPSHEITEKQLKDAGKLAQEIMSPEEESGE